jgi:hypothetical protein
MKLLPMASEEDIASAMPKVRSDDGDVDAGRVAIAAGGGDDAAPGARAWRKG